MIFNGHALTVEHPDVPNYREDALLSKEPPKVQECVLLWIKKYLSPTKKTVLDTSSSYGLKHILQNDTGIYLTNNQFKDAMLLSGYYPANPNELNWHFCISRRSLALKDGLVRESPIPREELYN